MGKEMKRDGRQHGMVRTYKSLPSPWKHPTTPNNNSKFVNGRLGSSPPTAGMFSKIQSQPTNHSKFTGKCGRPRCNGCDPIPMPTCYKAKDKIKGSNRRRSNDVVPNYKLSAWRIADGGPGLHHLRGSSATRILDHLAHLDYMDDGDEDHDYDHDYDTAVRNSLAETVPCPWPLNHYSIEACGSPSRGLEIRDFATVFDGVDDDGFGTDRDENDDDDDGMSFCDVGFVVDQIEGEEDWCLVKEL